MLSGGRVEVAIGAGWNRPEYVALGLPFDPVGVRVSRLTEAVAVLKGCFGPGPFSFAGEHYTITDYTGTPQPVYTGGTNPQTLVTDGTRLYWNDFAGNSVKSVP